MFYLPSLYQHVHSDALKDLPYYFATDARPNQDRIDPDLLEYWNQKNIRYDFNEHMFRTSHDFSKLKDGEFILATGCSHTVGSGIDYDSMYTTIIEKELGIPVVNIAVISSDINVVLRNLAIWIKNFPKPKFIMVQIPEASRFSYMFGQGKINTVVTSGGTPKENFKTIETLGMQYYMMHEAGYTQLDLLQCILESYGIDTFYFSIGEFSEYRNINFRKPILDIEQTADQKLVVHKIRNPKMKLYARDGEHGGDLINLFWATSILENLRNKR